MKGEGEVKLNMAVGKCELALRNYGAAGQEVVRSQLQEVEDAWATLLVTAMSCHRYSTSSISKKYFYVFMPMWFVKAIFLTSISSTHVKYKYIIHPDL